MKNYYHILGLDRQATSEEIKQAYRNLAMKYHPDRNPEKDTHLLFLEVSEAYHTLSNKHQKIVYDSKLKSFLGETMLNTPTYQRYEQVRQKRSSRYRRTRYSRRVTYKGNYSRVAASGKESHSHPAGEAPPPPPEHVRAQYHAKLSRENARKGLTAFLKVLKAVAAAAFLFCAFMLIDLHSSREVPSETILAIKALPWTFSDPGMIKVSTEHHQFKIFRSYQKRLRVDYPIRFMATPFLDQVTHVFIPEEENTYKIRTGEGLKGMSYILTVILLVFAPIFIWKKMHYEAATFLGTSLILVLVILLGMLSR